MSEEISAAAPAADAGVSTENTGAQLPTQAAHQDAQVSNAAARPDYQFGDEWINAIPEEYKGVFNQFKNPLDLADAYKNTKAALGRRAEHFTENDWKLLFQANETINDVPASPDRYKYEFQANPDVNLSQNHLEHPEDFNVLSKLAFDMNLNQTQANKLFNAYNQLLNHSQAVGGEQLQAVKANAVENLKKEWGDKFDNNVQYVNNSSKVISEVTGVDEETVKHELKALNFDASPVILKMLAKLGQRVSDGSRPGYGTTGMSRASATMKLNDFKNNPDNRKILGDRFHPDFKRKSSELSSLTKMAFGE